MSGQIVLHHFIASDIKLHYHEAFRGNQLLFIQLQI